MQAQVVQHRFFEYAMLCLILLSSLALCFDDNSVEPGSIKRQVLYITDIIFVICFGIEVSATQPRKTITQSADLQMHPIVNMLQPCPESALSANGELDLLHIMYPGRAICPMQACLKIMVFGFAFNGPDSYIRSPWNVLDFFVVVVCTLVLILEQFVSSNNIVWLRALRALRWAGPLLRCGGADN